MTEPRKLGPGAIPYTRAEAVEVARGIRRRAAATLEPYLQRAGEAQLEARDDPQYLEKIAARTGLDPETLEAALDIDGSIKMSAMVECLLDLQHACLEQGLDLNQCMAQANAMYRRQAVAFSRRLIYDVADDEVPTTSTVDTFFGTSLDG